MQLQPLEGEEALGLKYVDLDELLEKLHPENPKEHDLPTIDESFEVFGYTIPILLDENADLIGAGHGRVLQLQARRAAGLPAPRRILVRGDKWFVPVLTGVAFQDEDELLKYLIMDNRSPEKGGWKGRQTAEIIARLGKANLRGTGVSPGEIVTFLARLRIEARPGKAGVDPNAIPDPPKRATTKLGQLWQLGGHRLLCGDTRDAALLKRLVRGEKVAMHHADPPYGMGKEAQGIENDNIYDEQLDTFQMEWWKAWRPFLLDIGSAYIWGNAPDLWRLWWTKLEPTTRPKKEDLKKGRDNSDRILVRNEIVWDKGSAFGMRSAGGHSYPPATERCLFLMLGQQFLGNQNIEDFWEGYEPLRAWLEGEREKAGWSNGEVNKLTNSHMAGHWFTKSQFIPISAKHYKILREAAKGAAFREDYKDLFERLFPDVKKGGNEHRRDLSAALRETRTHFDNTHDAMTDVWQFGRVVGEERFGHATPKPVDMVARAIKSSSPAGGLVAAPFAGTGPEFIAAEQWDRRVVGMELNPGYCDVIVERWQAFSGKKARLVRS